MNALRWLSLALVLACANAMADWREALPSARMVGAGDLRLWGFNIYTARLFSPVVPFKVGAPLALELTYHRAISRDDLIRVSLEEIQQTSGARVNAEQLAVWRKEMQQAFIDVEPGMTITGVYVPGREARFYLGKRLLHVIGDAQFAEAFFAIWLDPSTSNPDLRAKLLGKS
ncbi:chalcone isomerase family protein [Pseudomonas sp. 21LCFQ02]|uniref:chalcone isomerase family protein n=1 Tax=unclassified Pseudomonas TaxID=196821 RepID=UPI0005EF203E|nr:MULTISPECIES: chalcone isomerase family protein [unclassified Pseudomonas]MCO8168813.1 chalcone isomerase family protein [Pseudomonas sp. 21LCFQ02]